jgi:CheY-like chemotaxis protein
VAEPPRRPRIRRGRQRRFPPSARPGAERLRRPCHGLRLCLIPAIAVTAFYEDFVAGSARNAGFDAYLTRPINFEALCVLVDHVAGLKRQHDSTAA